MAKTHIVSNATAPVQFAYNNPGHPATPMIVLGVVSYGNNWYNTGNVFDVKPLVLSGVAAILLGAFGSLPGMSQTAALLGWTAVVGMFLFPVQNPSPLQNLLSIGHTANNIATKS